MVQGFTQREGVDYNEVFAPVTNLGSIRIICALTTKYDLELDEMNVSTAYINGKLEEELYMLPPDCVEVKLGYCWRLKWLLYGLAQASCTWKHTLSKKLCKFCLQVSDVLCPTVMHVPSMR